MSTGLSHGVNKFFVYSISAISVIGMVGNVLVILAILGSAKMRATAMNTFLVNMAFADLFYIMTLAGGWVPYFYNDNWLWIWPPFLCRPYYYISNSMLHISELTYDAIVIERFLVICHPLSHRTVTMAGNGKSREIYRNLGIVAAIWAVMALVNIPILYQFLIIETTVNGTTCDVIVFSATYQCYNAPDALWLDLHRWITGIGLYFSSLLLSLVLYPKICSVLWAADQTIYKRERVVAAHTCSSDEDCQASKVTSEATKKQEEVLSSRRNVVKMLIICVALYFACITPSFVNYIVVNIFDYRPFAMWTPISILLFTICSSINPVFYTLYSTKIRSRIISLLQLKKCVSKLNSPTSTLTTSTNSTPNTNSTQLSTKTNE